MLLHSSYSVACRHSRNRNLDTWRNKVRRILARTYYKRPETPMTKHFFFPSRLLKTEQYPVFYPCGVLCTTDYCGDFAVDCS